MLSQHVEPQTLQRLDVEHHCLVSGRGVHSIGPEALIKSSKQEDEVTIQQRPFDSIDESAGDGPEASIALDIIITELDVDVIEVRRVWSPEAWIGDGKGASRS